jgi:hypothetical protein
LGGQPLTVIFTVLVDSKATAGMQILPHTALNPTVSLGGGWTTGSDGTVKVAGFASGQYAFELHQYAGRFFCDVELPNPPPPPGTPVAVTISAFTQVSVKTTVGGSPTGKQFNVRYGKNSNYIVEPGLPYDTSPSGTYSGLHILKDTHYFEIVGVSGYPSVAVTTHNQSITLGS